MLYDIHDNRSFVLTCFYHIVMFTGPFAFFAWWLEVHPTYLQNASAPLATVLSALSLCGALLGSLQTETNVDQTVE